MQSDRVTSARNGVVNMLMYYHQALAEEGCSDTKQVIATDLAEIIKLSDGQKEYILNNIKGISALDMISNMTVLLTKMEYDKKIDLALIKVIKQNMAILRDMVQVESKNK